MNLILMMASCGGGDWTLTTWGEDYIESGIPAAEFADGCETTFDRFEVALHDLALKDGDGADVAAIDGVFVVDVHQPGPHILGTAPVPRGSYFRVDARIAPDAGLGGNSVSAAGTVTCGGASVGFDWAFDTDTLYKCEPDGLTLPAGGSAETQITVHGDHLFYDHLTSEDASVRGQAIADADTDADGNVTRAELEAVSVADLGYGVGSFVDVTNLWQFVSELTRSLGHVDGEGHCEVE